MITIPTISLTGMNVFEQKKVLIYGKKGNPNVLIKVFKKCNIKVVGCCIEQIDALGKLKCTVRGVPYISPQKLSLLAQKEPSLIVQSIGFNANDLIAINKMATDLGVQYSPFSSGEIISSFASAFVINELQNFFFFKCREFLWLKRCRSKSVPGWKIFIKSKVKNAIVICSPPKTADVTLNTTFNGLNAKNLQKNGLPHIHYINLSHKSRVLSNFVCNNNFGTAKIIMGIREPISQNISRLYQEISTGMSLYNWILGDLHGKSSKDRVKILDAYRNFLNENGNNVQALWDAFVARYIYPERSVAKLSDEPKCVQVFLNEFKENVLDITTYPFDKEKGYTIIKDGNVEVFIYQLEKLNSLVPELSEFVGVPFDKLENANQASDKWVGESYKQAQKEIEITQEYFDKCFNEPYVKHCYSEADIEKFKARWRPHIRCCTNK